MIHTFVGMMSDNSISLKPATGEAVAAETKARILEVAERLFAERGLDAVSIRDITGAAQVNLGAINYHFGTKQELIAAVFDRRMGPLTDERLRALNAAEEAAGDKPPKLEAVLEAIFRPAIEQAMDPTRGGATFGKLMARCLVEPNPVVEKAMRGHFEPVVRRFDAALLRVMPKLAPEDVFWRMHLLIGALHHSLLMLDKKPPRGICLHMDAKTYVKRFVAFAAATFRVPLP